jgi:2-dehydrotetronate isomerase
MPRFSAHISWLFTERPMLERIGAAAAAGFKAVECRFPGEVSANDFKREVERHGLQVLGINTPQGGVGEFGSCAVPGEQAKWQAAFEETLNYVTTVGGSAVHCLAGKVEPAQRTEARKVYIENIKRAADQAAAKNVTILLEPINPRDQPGYFLADAETAVEIIAEVGRPNVKLQYDFYHMQIVGGDLISRFQKYLPVIGHLQVAAVPVRHEPDGGEINYPAVFRAVDDAGYKGWIGAEYKPRGRTEAGLGWGKSYGLIAS